MQCSFLDALDYRTHCVFICCAGTDCQDCGPVGNDNFTRSDDDGWWDDDDDYWNFNDGAFLGKYACILYVYVCHAVFFSMPLRLSIVYSWGVGTAWHYKTVSL